MKTLKVFCLLFFLLSQIISTQWQTDTRLTFNTSVSQTSFNYGWNIASTGDTLHVQFFDERNGGYTQVYYMRSLNKGVTWSAETRISNSNSFAERGTIAANGLIIHEVWQDMRNGWEIYYRRSTDAGATWGAETRLTNDAGNSWAPGVCVSGSVVHVFWSESRDGNMECYYKRSSDNGNSWGADTRLTVNSADSWYPSAAVQGNSVHVFWTDLRDGVYQVYYKKSTDAGLTWSSDTRLTATTFNAQNPVAAVNGNMICIVWCDNRDGNYELYCKRSTNAGSSWESDTRLTNSPGDSYNPSLFVSGTFFHLTWEDVRDGNYEIYYKKSTNTGSNWSSDTRLTNAAADSRYASVIASGNYVHTVWFDDRDGNREIYYKFDPTGNQLPAAPAAPVLFSPPHNSFNQAAAIRFIWNRSLFANYYRLQVSADSLFSNLVVNDSLLTDSTVLILNFNVNKYYWWRVSARNSFGVSPYSAIWKFGTFLVGIQPLNTEIPDEFKLYSNIPNPFNPSTKIRFEIPAGGNDAVQLKIFDMLGSEVRTLVNENLKPGIYEADLNAADLPSGVYFYKLSSGNFMDTKKMILIK